MSGTPGSISVWRRLVIGSNPRVTLIRAAVLGAITYLLLRYVFLPVKLRGVSMEPTYHDGALRVANLLRYARTPPQRGDVVVIEMAGRHAFYLKRVVGLPGERIAFTNGQLMVNGTASAEPYLQHPGSWSIPEVVVGEDEYYVAGDNRSVHWELHTLGTVLRSKIVGGVLF